MSGALNIRGYADGDAASVRNLFIRVNRLLAPPDMTAAFEEYIAASLAEEIERIPSYYAERRGSFWVAMFDGKLAGMFGLETTPDPQAMELRRMYVDPDMRRRGIARAMLQFAEDECRRASMQRLDLSTSALQSEALSLYRTSGYRLLGDEIATAASNKTVGGGIRRFHFSKTL